MKNNLKAVREAKRMTQSEVAKRAGLPYRTYQDYERGKREPSVTSAIKISKALKVSISKLFIIT